MHERVHEQREGTALWARLEGGIGVRELSGSGSAAVRGALEVVSAVDAHLCWEHAPHDHKADLVLHINMNSSA
jgi:hypothetical protein